MVSTQLTFHDICVRCKRCS